MPASLKGEMSNGAAIAVVIVIVIAVAAIFLFPGILSGSGINFNLFGGTTPTTLTGLGAGTAGVVITDFRAIPAITDGGSEVEFQLQIENKGEWDATDIKYDIFGIGDSLSWGSKSTSTGATKLTAANPSKSLIGESTDTTWTATPKEKNTDVTYTVTGRVDYKYETDTNVEMQLYGRKDPNVARLGITNSKLNSIKTTAGPINVGITGNLPLLTGSSDSFSIVFEITNVGGGRPYVGSITSGLDKVKLTATGCEIKSDNTEPRLNNNKKTVRCEVKPSISEDKNEAKSVRLNIEYNYLVEKPTTVTVLKSDNIVN